MSHFSTLRMSSCFTKKINKNNKLRVLHLALQDKDGLYCRLFKVNFYNSEYTLIRTNMKQFQGLHKTVHLLQNEHAHLFSRNQVLIKFLNLKSSELLRGIDHPF